MNAPAEFPTQQIVNRLRYWRKHIERALRDPDLMTYADIELGVVEQCMWLFDNPRAFAVVEIHDYTKGRVGHVLVAGGSIQGLKELQEQSTPFFKEIGARRLHMAGRQGFLRKLPALGWTQPRVVMEYEFEHHQDLCRRTG
jgi:hypothetical protein